MKFVIERVIKSPSGEVRVEPITQVECTSAADAHLKRDQELPGQDNIVVSYYPQEDTKKGVGDSPPITLPHLKESPQQRKKNQHHSPS